MPPLRETDLPNRGWSRFGILSAFLVLFGLTTYWAVSTYIEPRPHTQGNGPTKPVVPRAPWTRTWTQDPVVLLGLGDSITAGFGASPGLSYFDRLVSNPPDEFPAMKGISLNGANLRGAVMELADLRGAKMLGADLRGANLRTAELSHAYLMNADLRGTRLPDVYASMAQFNGADLRGADMRRGDFRSAVFHKANLRGASMDNADLMGADLRRTDLRDADLRKADLSKAQLKGALYNDRTRLPFKWPWIEAGRRGMIKR